MTIQMLSDIVSQMLGTPDLSKLYAVDRDNTHGHKKAIASLIPYVGGAVAGGEQGDGYLFHRKTKSVIINS
jgi:hypothetical protein